ncbi:hypothetical protein [Virgibacillus sp. DJP39]|uniref:hypothetical protein n=1 Tax=Virgibacillus sp. DJP39 TaxID=3409790 RepID=UPI003BB771BF
MSLFGKEKTRLSRKWTKITRTVFKSFLALTLAGSLVLLTTIVYLLIQDYFYNEKNDVFN